AGGSTQPAGSGEALQSVEWRREGVQRVGAGGSRIYSPGWHLALDLRNMSRVSECVAKAARLREESRGGHTRDDHPGMRPEWRRKLLVCSTEDGTSITVEEQEQPAMRGDLISLFDRDELSKYLTDEEMAEFDRIAK